MLETGKDMDPQSRRKFYRRLYGGGHVSKASFDRRVNHSQSLVLV